MSTATGAPFSLVPAEHPPTAMTTALQVASRTVRKYVRSPQLVAMSTATGATWLLIFRYVFGGAIEAGPVPYVDYLVPGFVLGIGVLFQGMNASVGVAEDIEHGFFDRLRSLPVPRTALLVGRSAADTVVVAYGLAITTAIGFLVGFRIHGDIGEALAALAAGLLWPGALEAQYVRAPAPAAAMASSVEHAAADEAPAPAASAGPPVPLVPAVPVRPPAQRVTTPFAVQRIATSASEPVVGASRVDPPVPVRPAAPQASLLAASDAPEQRSLPVVAAAARAVQRAVPTDETPSASDTPVQRLAAPATGTAAETTSEPAAACIPASSS
jgi:hypothetical protein